MTTKLTNPCRHRCIGGELCVLRGDIAHKLHICNDEDCDCHQEERYLAEPRPQQAFVSRATRQNPVTTGAAAP